MEASAWRSQSQSSRARAARRPFALRDFSALVLVARDRANLEDTAEAVKAAGAKAPYAAVGTINAAIVALAKAFSDRGVADCVQANSVLPGPAMTGRRRSYLEHWARYTP